MNATERGRRSDALYYDNVGMQRRRLCDMVANLESDNAKLRKLLLDVWNDACEFDGFWDYVMDDGELYSKDELPHYQERMRELGIEA